MRYRTSRESITVVILGMLLGGSTGALADEARGKPPRNVIVIICDQETHRLTASGEYRLPAREALARRGVTFGNHYIASAMCSPSRAVLLSGQPPQVNGVTDNMGYAYVPNLKTDQPSMGTVMKALGYQTAYFGKFEMDHALLVAKANVDDSAALRPYGFDTFGTHGDVPSGPRDGYNRDSETATDGVAWLRANGAKSRQKGKPFFLILSFLNPHDIMYADANVPGQPPAQRAVSPRLMPPLPRDTLYETKWDFSLAPSLGESLTAPGMPPALAEYRKGWNGVLGQVPSNRQDMWRTFYNYYLNCLRDNDRSLMRIVDAIDELKLWDDTAVVLTADHGEMAGAHGGLKGKGPFCYEANAHVPLIITHPDARPGSTCQALTSHLDLLPTLVGLAGIPQADRPASIQGLPGHDVSMLLADPEKAPLHASRPGVLFNYLGLQTVDGDYLLKSLGGRFEGKLAAPPLTEIDLDKRGFLAFAFDGRHKFARYYSPNGFNTPVTKDQIFKRNDVQLFDLKSDPDEVRNLALEPEENEATILRMNALLNALMSKEVGANDGKFLPEAVRPRAGKPGGG